MKQSIFTSWRNRDLTGVKVAINHMKRDFSRLKEFNPESEYIEKLENFINDKIRGV